MRRWISLAARLSPILLVVGCSELPRSFSRVSLEKAGTLLSEGGVAVVDAVAVGVPDPGPVPGGIRWRVARNGRIAMKDGTPAVPPGAVLVIASTERIGYRSAAVLAREGNRPVYVFIPGSEQERSRLAGVMVTKEATHGEDS